MGKNEISFNVPFEKIYQASLKEASRKKPVFFIHKYFARRITSNFRLALLDYLYPENNDLMDKFYSSSFEKGNHITVLDPFMGGGTTILESLRFGCKTIGNDLQPLSYFVTKALVEEIDETKIRMVLNKLEKTVGAEIKKLYTTTCLDCGKAADTMYAFHVKKVKSACKEEYHRFFSSFVIAFKKNVFTIVCPKCGELTETKFENGQFECGCGWILTSPKDSYVKRGIFQCEECEEKEVLSNYKELGEYPFLTDIIALEYYCPCCKSHRYKKPDSEDINKFKESCQKYDKIKQFLPIPQQRIPKGYNTNQIINHGYNHFKDMFNKRQLLSLGILLNHINEIDDVKTKFWFQLTFSGMLEMNNMFCRYQQNAYKICNIFFNHAYVPLTMPVENCVWGTTLGTGTFVKTLKKVIRGKKFNKEIYDLNVKMNESGKYDSVKVLNGDIVEAKVVNFYDEISSNRTLLACSDSRKLDGIPNDSVNIVLTDPPYGANVMYSELIDFFHCWNYLSSSANEFGFTTPLSPKGEEIIVNTIQNKNFNDYQEGITQVFKECHKKLKDDGVLVFSFHDKSLDSWLSIISSIYSAGYTLTKAYPVQAETRTGAHTSGKNSIGIDIMLVSKKTNTHLLTELSINKISNAVEDTIAQVKYYIEKLNSVGADLTLPDIENMIIGSFFANCSSIQIYNGSLDDRVIKSLDKLIADIESEFDNLKIVDKRTGWWSKLFQDKWNV